jgi:L-aminopeptidase/D-esterase-like protein
MPSFKGLTDIEGILVGHATDLNGVTGCTAILCPQGAIAGVDIRGSASGTEETPVLDPGHTADRVHAVVFSGGSAFGLEATSGVRHHLRGLKVGFPTTYGHVPIVTGAILYDLGIGKADAFPDRAMGAKAASAAHSGKVEEGCVGAGTGATVGKLRGMAHAMKAGVGSATFAMSDNHSQILVSALAVVNPFGDVVDEKSSLVAGTRVAKDSMRLLDSEAAISQGSQSVLGRVGNTTLVVVATNAKLDRVQANKLAQYGSLGVGRAIRPIFTQYDGDVCFALSCGQLPVDLNALGVAAAKVVHQAILRAVRLATTIDGVPAVVRK